MAESREDLVSELRRDAGTSAGEELSGVFDTRARTLARAAKTWLKILIVTSIAAVSGAIITFLVLAPEEGAKGTNDFAALGLGVFILGILVFGIRICAQNYRVNRHLHAVANSKAAALSTFKRLVASVEEQEIRSTLALALAQAVFATEDTGLVDATGDHVTLVERAVIPRITSSPPTP